MKKIISFLISISIILGNFPVYAFNIEQAVSKEDKDCTFIVEVTGEPSLVNEKAMKMGASSFCKTENFKREEEKILNSHNKVLSSIKQSVSEDIEKGYTYTAIFNGFSIDGKTSDKEKLLKIPGVKNVYISGTQKIIKPEMDTASDISGVTDFKNNKGLTGKGEAVAILDSEFDTGHDFFKTAVENPKYKKEDIANIIKNNSFNVDISANQVYKNTKIPFAYDYGRKTADTYGNKKTPIHGTHVAGIAGGKNGKTPDGKTFSGVAEDAQLILMKVSGEDGSLNDFTIIAALDDASKFGVSAVNLSLGTAYSVNDLKYDVVFNNMVNAGINVSVAAGNENRGYREKVQTTEYIDYSSMGSPSINSHATTIASCDNSKFYVFASYFVFEDGTLVNFSTNEGKACSFDNLAGDKFYEYVYCKSGSAEDLNNLDLRGKLALVKRGNKFTDTANLLKEKGALGFILWNYNEESIILNVEDFPWAVVKQSDGQKMFDNSVKKIKVTKKLPGEKEIVTKGQCSEYTSWGVNGFFDLKPDITAPGGKVYSSYPNNEYKTLRGTSMSAPYFTGTVALMSEFYKTNPYIAKYNNLTGKDKVLLFNNIFMSSADIIVKENGVFESPRRQGAGRLNLNGASETPAIITGKDGRTKIILGTDLKDSFDLSFTVKNLTDKEVSYDSLSVDVMTDGYVKREDGFYPDGMRKLKSTVVNNPGKIIIPAGGEKTFDLKVNLDNSELIENAKIFTNGFYIDGFISLKSQNKKGINMPFAGFYGDFEKAPIFDKTIYDEGESILYDPQNPLLTGTHLSKTINGDIMFYAGTNIFDIEERAPETKYIAVSGKPDNLFDLVMECRAQLLRPVSAVKYYVKDKQGNIILDTDVKPFLYGKFSQLITGIDVPEDISGDLIYCIDGFYNTKNSQKYDTLEIPFTVDNEDPSVDNAEYNKDTEKVKLTVSDNHYISAVMLEYQDKDNNKKVSKKVYYGNKQGNERNVEIAEFDITGIDDSRAYIKVYDYATNNIKIPLNVITEKISATIVKYNNGNNATTLDYIINNNSNAQVSSDVIVVFYDKFKNIIHMTIDNDVILDSGINNFKYRTLENTTDTDNIRIFVWDDLLNLKPLSKGAKAEGFKNYI